MMTNQMHDASGMTLFEMLISIIVGSIVISILMTVLTLSINAKAEVDYNNRLLNESYYITESIQSTVATLQLQSISITSDTSTETIVQLTHTLGNDLIIYDKTNNQLSYQGYADASAKQLHNNSTAIIDGSSLDLISIDPTTCDLSVIGTTCDHGIIQLTINIEITLGSGSVLTPKSFTSTILV